MNNVTPPNYTELQKNMGKGGNSYWGGFLKQGVYGATPSQKKSFRGRILPMFDYSLSKADSLFTSSWAPYRDVNNVIADTGQPDFTAFFGVAAAYSWFGNKNVSFLSATTLKYTHGITRGPELCDPVMDIRNYARKHDDPAIRALCEKEENKKDAKTILPFPSIRYFFNFYGTSGVDRTPRNYVIDMPKKAFDDLAAKLSEWRPAHEAVVDENWPNFLYGDITDPETGLMVDTVQIPSVPQPFNGFVLTSGSHKSLRGTQQMPVPKEALLHRSQFYHDESVFKILPVQEIVDFLVDDGAIPYHLVQQICSSYANINPQPKRNTMVSSGSDDEPAPEYVPRVPPARTVVAPPAPPPPPPTPVKVPVTYWVSVDGNVSADAKSPADARAMVQSYPAISTVLVCEVGTSVWVDPSTLWNVSVALAAPPPPPPVKAAPPPMPAPPSVQPSAPPTLATRTKPAGASEPLTAEEEEELSQLEAAFVANEMGQGHQQLTRLVFLRKRKGKDTALPD